MMSNRREFLSDVLRLALLWEPQDWATPWTAEWDGWMLERVTLLDTQVGSIHTADHDTVERGITTILNDLGNPSDLWVDVGFASLSNTASDLTAKMADAIVQTGLFGRIIYS